MTEQQPEYLAKIEQRQKEAAMLLKYAAMKQAQEAIAGAAKIYIDMTHDIEAAFVLDELLFWTLPKSGKTSLRVWKDGYLWLAVSRAEWWERKRLSSRQADRAIDKLIAMNLVFKEVFRFNSAPTTHLRVNIPVFFKLLFDEVGKIATDDQNKDLQDIKDLYAMMGAPFSPNGNLPFSDTESPFSDTNSPNSENINSTNQPSPLPKNKGSIPSKPKPESSRPVSPAKPKATQARPPSRSQLFMDAMDKCFGIGLNLTFKAHKDFLIWAIDQKKATPEIVTYAKNTWDTDETINWHGKRKPSIQAIVENWSALTAGFREPSQQSKPRQLTREDFVDLGGI